METAGAFTMITPSHHATAEILDNLASAVIVVDAALVVQWLNATGEVLLQVSARQAMGDALFNIAPGLNVLSVAIDHVKQQASSYAEREIRVLLSGERTVTLDCVVTPLPEGRLLLELEHIDRHLRISRESRMIAQNAAIRELVRGLAHEIKNPLGGLRGAAQLLEAELDQAELREYTHVIMSEADRLRALVDGLLGPEKALEKKPTNVHEILERVRHLAVAEAPEGVVIRRDYDPSLPPLPAAADQLIQALLNIVRNALQALEGDGEILLRTRSQRRFTIGQKQHRLVLRIDVLDNGPGIPLVLQDQIFYPMVTGRSEGTGIGLPIAQNLVDRHGGLIECNSEPGRTLFTVWLPLEDTDE